MSDWKYEAGKWEKIQAPFPWEEGEDLKSALSRAGYYGFPSESWGENGVDIYCRQDDEPPWYISFTIADYCFGVSIYDEQNLLEWIAKYTPAYSLAKIAYDLDDLKKIIEKAFRAWHGHSSDVTCSLCDPGAYRRQQEFRQRRANKRRDQ